jgi:Tetratricopeptide repeat
LKAINNIATLGLLTLVLIGAAGFAASASAAAAVPAATCPANQPGAAVIEAQSAVAQNPDELSPQLRLANAWVDQGCYEQAVATLDATLKQHPHNAEVMAKLRDVRSMLTEQTFIQNVTQAEDAARLQHDQLRCSKFADLEACTAVLRVSPNDPVALAAKADAGASASSPVNPSSGAGASNNSPSTGSSAPTVAQAAPTAKPSRSTVVASAVRRSAPPSPKTAPTFTNTASAGRTN